MKTISLLGGKHVSRLIPFLVLMNLSVHALAHHPPAPISRANPTDQITGTVYDFSGPLPGVSVTVKNTRTTTKTDQYGAYTISVSPGHTLVFTYPGYDTVEITYTDQLVIDAELYEAITLEEAVINAGYYSVKEKERTGSISKITSKEIENQPVNNVLGALEGRIPGVEVTPTTGLAGGGYTVRIRGQNSIAAGNEPLYIIDGVPYDMNSMADIDMSGGIFPRASVSPLNTIDPASIESIEVLKDADATAIYGSRGANGVILITTKKGVYGKTNVTFEASTTVSRVAKFMDLLNTEQYLSMRKQAFENDGITTYPSTAYDINGTWDPNRYTDWQKELTGGNAYNQNFRLLISGGSEQTRFSVGGSFMKETTVYPSDFNYKKTSTYANIVHNSKDNRLSVQFGMQYGLDSNKLPSEDPFALAIRLAPNAPDLYDEDGDLNWENSTWNNPLASFKNSYVNQSKNFLLNGYFGYKILEGIKFQTRVGYNTSDLSEVNYRPYTMFNPAFGFTVENSNSFHNNHGRETWVVEPQIDGAYQFGSLEVKATIGGTLQENSHKQLKILGLGYPNEFLFGQINAANQIIISSQTSSQYSYIAAYGRLNFNWDNKYIINLTGRRDGSSRFGPGNQFANFGAIGAAWIFTNENFLANMPWLNFGKLRGSFGVTGNDQIGNYQYLDTYTVSNNTYDENVGLAATRLFNPNFGWEKNRKAEVALELQMFNHRISFEASYYDNRSDNLLLPTPMPGTTGFSSINSNLDATVSNRGFELSLKSVNLNKANLRWETSINLTAPKNELISFDGLENSPYVNRVAIGHSLNISKLYQYLGVNTETGIFEFVDFDGDGMISSPNDNLYIADFSPKLLGSISNSLRYKNWELDFLFQYVNKKGYNQYRNYQPAGYLVNQPVGVLDNWDAMGSTYQIFTTGNNPDAFLGHSRFVTSSGVVSDASFLRLKTASIGYKINLKNVPNCTLYFQGYNLLTFTNYKGGDPEKPSNNLPPLRKFQLGLKLEF